MIARVVVVAIAGCGAALPAVPGRGGPAWVELESEHFTLWTDASVARGRELVREMEHLRQVVSGVAFASLPDAGRSFVVALRDSAEVGVFIPSQFAAEAWPGENPIRQPMIVLAADTGESDGHVLVHELAHVISHGVIRRQPHWFAEGLAGFFETVHFDADRTVVDVGEPSAATVRSLRREHLVPGPQLFACAAAACMDHAYYTTAWALFSYLTATHPTELARLEQLLDQIPGQVPAATAWHQAFPDLAPEQIDGVLRDWLQHGKRIVRRFNVQLRAWPIAVRTLGDADVYAVRALVRSMSYPQHPQIAVDRAAALAADRTNVLALVLGDAISPGEARAAAAAHPDDWRAWWLVVRAAPTDDDARTKACTLVAHNPAVVPPPGMCR